MSAAEEPAVSVPLDRIHFDKRLQVRRRDGGTQFGVVRKYETVLRSGRKLPPITLARLDGVLYCADGWHRTEAHRNLGRYEIEAHIADVATIEEAEWIAARGNLQHGLPLTRKDEKEAFRRFIRANQHKTTKGRLKSYRDIAHDFGGSRSHTTIRNWIESLYPAIYRAMGGGREVYVREDRGGTYRQQGRLKDAAVKALEQIRTVLPGIKDGATRGAILAEAEGLFAEMRAGTAWDAMNPQDIEPF